MIAFFVYGIGALLSLAATLAAVPWRGDDRGKIAVLAFGMALALTWPIVVGALIYAGLTHSRPSASY